MYDGFDGSTNLHWNLWQFEQYKAKIANDMKKMDSKITAMSKEMQELKDTIRELESKATTRPKTSSRKKVPRPLSVCS